MGTFSTSATNTRQHFRYARWMRSTWLQRVLQATRRSLQQTSGCVMLLSCSDFPSSLPDFHSSLFAAQPLHNTRDSQAVGFLCFEIVPPVRECLTAGRSPENKPPRACQEQK